LFERGHGNEWREYENGIREEATREDNVEDLLE